MPEFQPLLDGFNGAGLVPNAHVTLTNNAKELKSDRKETQAFKEAVAAGAREGVTAMPGSESQAYAKAIERILNAIGKKQYAGLDDLFTPEGHDMFERLIHYGNAKILGKATRDTYEFYPMKERVVCRSIPMQFSFEGGKRKFTEDVTFTFNSDGLIESLAFGLGSVARQEYFSSSYGDVGYLYLMVDFLNPDEPVIKVRTWQPERKPDLTPNLPKDSPYNGIFSNGYFG